MFSVIIVSIFNKHEASDVDPSRSVDKDAFLSQNTVKLPAVKLHC